MFIESLEYTYRGFGLSNSSDSISVINNLPVFLA